MIGVFVTFIRVVYRRMIYMSVPRKNTLFVCLAVNRLVRHENIYKT